MKKKYFKLIVFIAFLQLFTSCVPSMISSSSQKKPQSVNLVNSGVQTQDKHVDGKESFREIQRRESIEYYKKWVEHAPPNPRQLAYSRIMEESNSIDMNNLNTANYNSVIEDEETSLKAIGFNELSDNSQIKYRRSSLYTMMLSDTTYQYYYPIREAFGKTKLSEKFNNHNIGPYLIPLQIQRVTPPKRKKKSLVAAYFSGGVIPLLFADRSNRRRVALKDMKDTDLTQGIENYLNKNNVAKHLVARWFNRDQHGAFNMDLVAKRGEYNASELDIKVALHSVRGKALLKDAGEELIKNTFLVVYDFETGISLEAGGLGFAERDTYFFKVKSYLYRLVWDEETAAIFYNKYWMDKNNINPERKKAFEKSTIFKLKYVGATIVKDEQKIPYNSNLEQTMSKMIDMSIADLQWNYEEFRIKFPLYSGDPIMAKVGKKEGIQEGDKFEVLEQVLSEDGTTEYYKKGTIKVDKEENVWDNTFVGEWSNDNFVEGTIFKGTKGKYHPGMLIRQVN